MVKTTLQKISDHVYWMHPSDPDRPSLCAVVGEDRVVMLDAGASTAHAREFLDQLNSLGISRPEQIVLSHWHWDHVFGASEIGAQVIAQSMTAEKLVELSQRDWSESGLEQQVAAGLETEEGASNIKAELPSPRNVNVAQADVVFQRSFELNLGDVSCQVEHVGGDHALDSSIVFIQPDRVLFLGDCLAGVFYAPKQYYTIERLIPLLDRIQGIDADYYVEGHCSKVATRAEFDADISKIREAVKVVEKTGPDEERAFTMIEEKTGQAPDEDYTYYIQALIEGLRIQQSDSNAEEPEN